MGGVDTGKTSDGGQREKRAMGGLIPSGEDERRPKSREERVMWWSGRNERWGGPYGRNERWGAAGETSDGGVVYSKKFFSNERWGGLPKFRRPSGAQAVPEF
jgi:hypothetical protein